MEHIAMARVTPSMAISDTVDPVSAGDSTGDDPPPGLASDALEHI